MALCAGSADIYVYTGGIGPRHVLIAWGTARGQGNSIGRASTSHGRARLRVGPRTVETARAWAVVDGLEPDRAYDYELTLDGASVAQGHLRTWPERASSCSFLVVGDFGDTGPGQLRIAAAMARLVRERASTPNPIRFVLTTGDNIRVFISGAGGALRDGDVRARMDQNNIEAWAAQRHFLVVDVAPDRMTVMPAGDSAIQPVRADGSPFPLPVGVDRRPAIAAPPGLRH